MSKKVLAGTLGSILILVATLASPSVVSATTVTYVDQNEVWLSTIDGKTKKRLSSGEGDWRQVTAADGGRMLGVRLEEGKIFQLSKIHLWDKDGKTLSQGPLPSENLAWSSYGAPAGLDLSGDGVFLSYGYFGYTGIVPNANFYNGHNVVNADTKTLIDPIGQEGLEWPSMYGRRVVAGAGGVIYIQPAGSGPFGTDWNPLVDVSGSGLDLGRTDVSATGRMMAIELRAESAADDRIALVSVSGVEPPVTIGPVDCFLPAVGDASAATLSQDGTKIAWEDDQGVKVAGVPTGPQEPCVLSSPPVTISPTGSSPSIGGAVLSVVPSVLNVVLPPKLKVGSLAGPKGVVITVRAPVSGKVTVTGTVPASRLGLKGKRKLVVIKGTAVAGKAGPVKVKLKIVPKYRKFKARLKGTTVTLKITQGSKSISRKVKLK